MNSIDLAGGHTTMDRRLDRLPQWDERNQQFPISALLTATAPRTYVWGCDTVLDQGMEGACVGFSVSGELRARPKKVEGITNESARALYRRAQQLDEWPGEDYEGTSVLAGIKAAKEQGNYAEYRWAWSVDDLATAVSWHGPAVLGIPWYSSMYTPVKVGARHWVKVSGEVVGGHAILCLGYSTEIKAFRLHNSWGTEWGDNGRAWLSKADLARLLEEDGEACIPVVR